MRSIWSCADSGKPSATPQLARGNGAAWAHCFSRNYLLPFEIVSVLLLVAMVGVILLSKKDLK